jgi:hypothetical protein
MKNMTVQTIEKVIATMQGTFNAANQVLHEKTEASHFQVDHVHSARGHLNKLERTIEQIALPEILEYKQLIEAYIALKLDTLAEILALEMLIYDKKRTYQELLVKSNREYARLVKMREEEENGAWGNTISEGMQTELKIELANEIFKFKNYLDELATIADTKRIILTNKLVEAQQKNQQILELLKPRKEEKGVLANVFARRFAITR